MDWRGGRGMISAAPVVRLQAHATAATRTGPLHAQNEDAFASLNACSLYVVADGVGGLAEGAVASRVVVEMLQRVVDPGASFDLRVQQAREAIARANTALFEAGREADNAMGTTVVLTLIAADCALCLWAGDSRAYLARGGALHRITSDHAVFARVAEDLPPRSMITRAVGPDESVDLDCVVFDLAAGDSLLLCSDGVCGAIPENRLELLLTDPDADAEDVVAEAVAWGTRDDATALVIRIGEEEATHVAGI
ncbi:MAG: protein phosphatase 2C domain-containing protein [Pseudomonadota bacterium]